MIIMKILKRQMEMVVIGMSMSMMVLIINEIIWWMIQQAKQVAVTKVTWDKIVSAPLIDYIMMKLREQ